MTVSSAGDVTSPAGPSAGIAIATVAMALPRSAASSSASSSAAIRSASSCGDQMTNASEIRPNNWSHSCV